MLSQAACRLCNHAPLENVLALGKTPLANRLLNAAQLREPEPQFPLSLVFCAACSLVQIAETVPPEQLFSDYPYFSSFSDTMLASAGALVSKVRAAQNLGSRSLALEIASNDGYLLQYYAEQGIPVLGIEPAANVAKQALAKGIPTRVEFFGPELAAALAGEGTLADVLHANNVLAHVPNLNGFVSGIRQVLKPHGVAIVEVPYVRDLVEHVEFDTIYHEHLCYFSLTALTALFNKHGLQIVDVERIPLHGGSLRLWASASATPNDTRVMRVEALLAEERELGMAQFAYYEQFASRVATLKTELRSLISELRSQGARLAAYGASAKGSTLLNYCELGARELEFVADRSTVKQGKFTPGTHLPIVAPEALLQKMPDYVLLLTWNFAQEIMQQQSAYLQNGGRFIIPVPSPHIA